MDLKEYQIDVIELLAQHEETIEQLYKEFSNKFVTHNSFWSNISHEEKDHACWIRKLLKDIKKGAIIFNEDRFQTAAVKSSIDYVKEQIRKLQSESFSELNALAVAYNIENALLESKFFEVFEGDSVKLKNILSDLNKATKVHRETIKETLEQEKKVSSK